MDGLKDKVVLIAGAATGLGADSAHRLAREGARVVVGDIDAEGAERTAASIRATGGEATAAQFDISDDDSVRALVASTVDGYGGLDAVHINAGDMSAVTKDSDVVSIDLDVWDRTVAVNLRGHMLVTRHTVPLLLERGGGAIVYTSSIASFTGDPQRPAYSATKAGINALARHVASRWGREGIRANAVTPGLILTDEIREGAPPDLLAGMLARTRSTRLGEAADVSSMVAYLMSDDGSWINGQVVNVDGGTVLR
ncbi:MULTISPECIES: SDR family NAD(P)-dependent oxidoreductase [unclassified Rhodococcus (in: high G+C Gram-positive bacteria)]|jgi:NAD(P)-dependent dehydrogenase (short-subunit alcohol dehydrogenase family)|uniref:SDR family NAD(P)-dependent oxidoreductase n=1 Tax=unclassified Rhodococcus (in: high G+C Gram-positive bacteria) TaxID=192944 RepID=UPI00146ECD43|nr:MULTISPECIES: SDR family NAD(P)-dependent oxidoreductase [unclassified Rhodococcus (in: high G+C Gram-positive bacteria)]MBF0662400.1 SDR family oxidoreductase [Rhodococcus sp. (in: high G+C Gram-positive bacteria)]NMD96737.1 SDR family oxidoreductase [Rhodococcus sp. BL-253-APC-6A1W]